MGVNYGEKRGRLEEISSGNIFIGYAIGMNNNNNSKMREFMDDEIMYDFINDQLDIVEKRFRENV